MNIIIELGKENDIDELENLYIPAIKLYEKCGFKYIDTVDLGLKNYGLDWFKLYEKVIQYST